MLTHYEWFMFGSGGGSSTARICRLSKGLVAALGAHTSNVHCKQGYAAKMRHKHRRPAHELYLLPITIEHGKVLQFSKLTLGFHYWHEEQSAWYETVVKVTVRKHQIWVATFHRQSKAEIKRKQKKYPVIAR
jgi:hypothetical protein